MVGVIQVGKKYSLTKGRRAGEKVTVSKIVDERYVVVTTAKGKERKSSVNHLLPEHK
jgi:ribosomal protein L14E/L6E/L27E